MVNVWPIFSRVGEGSLFWMTARLGKLAFPGAADAAPRPPEPMAPRGQGGSSQDEARLAQDYRGSRILLVEDDQVDAMTQALTRLFVTGTGGNYIMGF